MTEIISSVADVLVKSVSENSRTMVPALLPFTLMELRLRIGTVAEPRMGLVIPVVVLTMKSPTAPLNVTTPESALMSPPPLSDTVTLLAP